MLQLVTSEQQRKFGLAKRDTLPKYCRECSVSFACTGSVRRIGSSRTGTASRGLNYLCAGYMAFFKHIDRPMRLMADLLRRAVRRRGDGDAGHRRRSQSTNQRGETL